MNAEARYEWFFDRDQRLTVGAFYKKLDNPIETYSSILSSDITTSFANAPKASLYGIELEAQKYFPISDWSSSAFFADRRLVAIGNYTYTKSKLKVGANDTTIINGVVQAAANFFRDGSPLTGQADHLVNLQLGMEDTENLSQQTFLLSYASERVTTRGPSGQPDVKEQPGFRLDGAPGGQPVRRRERAEVRGAQHHRDEVQGIPEIRPEPDLLQPVRRRRVLLAGHRREVLSRHPPLAGEGLTELTPRAARETIS